MFSRLKIEDTSRIDVKIMEMSGLILMFQQFINCEFKKKELIEYFEILKQGMFVYNEYNL